MDGEMGEEGEGRRRRKGKKKKTRCGWVLL